MGYFLAFLSAVLFCISFPLYTTGYLVFAAFVPLFLSITVFSGSRFSSFLRGGLFGLTLSVFYSIPLFHALVTNYYKGISSVLLITATVFLPYSLIYGLFALTCRWFYGRNIFFYIIIPPSAWIIIDYLREITSVSIPWAFAGYTLAFTPFIQLADIAGIYGITFIIILSNVIITEIITSDNRRKFKLALILLFILSSALMYGIIRKNNISQTLTSGIKKNILIVQGNSDSRERWNNLPGSAKYNIYYTLTKNNIMDSDYIIWPETVLTSSDAINYNVMTSVSSLLGKDSLFFTGGIRTDKNGNYFNSAFALDNNGLRFIYDKNILFPYSERPFFGYTAGSFLNSPEKFAPGGHAGLCRINNLTAGFTICFETLYPSYVRKLDMNGAGFLINMANDSWFGDGSAPYIQLYSLISRAVENRFYILRAANSGISCVISPAGEIVDTIGVNNRGFIKSEINISRIDSLYMKAGDWIIIISIIFLFAALYYSFYMPKKIN